MNLRDAVDIPPLWLALFAAGGFGQARLIGPDLRALWGWPAGGVLVLAGMALMAASAVRFMRQRTSIVPHRKPVALITSGVYRFSRNPIYLADTLILAGLCLGWGAVSGLVLVPAFMALIQRRFILAEESRLGSAFGPDFTAWATRTPRWL